MKGKYDYDLIRDYLHGIVDRETARRIRELIRTDEVARDIAAGILRLEHEFNGNEEEIEAYIEKLREKQLSLIAPRRVYSGWMKMAAAILLVALVSAVVWLTVWRGDVLTEELSEPYPLSAIVRDPEELNPGFEFYRKGKYKSAIAAFENSSDDANILFYKGLSHLYAGEYDQAAGILGSLEASRYREQAEWFCALALMKAGRKDEARKMLKEIGGDEKRYKSKEAVQLLDEF
jgi:hypothetical protein